MFGMNLLYANSFYGGGYGCCCCARPAIDPFMLGVMRGYMMSRIAYAQMPQMNMPLYAGNSNLNLFPTLKELTTNNNQNKAAVQTSSNTAEAAFEENEELNKRYEEASKKWDAAFKKSTSTAVQASGKVTGNASGAKVSAGTAGVSAKGKELLSNPDFMYKVQKIASELKCSTEDLIAVMNAESGLNPAAGTNAVGLIQFTAPAIKALNQHGCNITKEELRNMDAVKQLDYVEKFLKMSKAYRFSADDELSAGDLYAIIFLPGRAKGDFLAKSGEAYYSANKGLDINKDGVITKDELSQRVKRFSVSLVA